MSCIAEAFHWATVTHALQTHTHSDCGFCAKACFFFPPVNASLTVSLSRTKKGPRKDIWCRDKHAAYLRPLLCKAAWQTMTNNVNCSKQNYNNITDLGSLVGLQPSVLDLLILEIESDNVRVWSIAPWNPSSCVHRPQTVDWGLPSWPFHLFSAVQRNPTELVWATGSSK